MTQPISRRDFLQKIAHTTAGAALLLSPFTALASTTSPAQKTQRLSNNHPCLDTLTIPEQRSLDFESHHFQFRNWR